MKKIMMLLVLLLCACTKNIYNEEEIKLLEKYDVLEKANNCQNSDSVKVMLKGDFKKENIEQYCSMIIEDPKGINTFIKHNVSEEDIKEYQSYAYMKEENIERYINYKADTIKDKIIAVNANMDLKPFAFTEIIEDDSDMSMLINKFYALKEGYVPNDMVEIKEYLCVLGEDYSCPDLTMMLRKEAADAYLKFAADAKEENIYVRAIATYRSYEYQSILYNYNKNLYGEEYADEYYARPGQSEHNSGLAVDITFNNHNFTEIEDKEGYDWILNNMHKYGFILRYPKDKVDVTRYSYESWHLRYVGIDVAKVIYENNLTLEEYHAMK